MKRCSRCKKEKELSLFYTRNGKPVSECKACSLKAKQLSRIRNTKTKDMYLGDVYA